LAFTLEVFIPASAICFYYGTFAWRIQGHFNKMRAFRKKHGGVKAVAQAALERKDAALMNGLINDGVADVIADKTANMPRLVVPAPPPAARPTGLFWDL
jgi:hypothetical protein